jgi:prepilin peptidase CpaA
MSDPDYALWAVAALYAAALIAAGVTDIRARKIPNWTVIALLALFIPWLFVGPQVSWVSSLEAFGIALVVTVALYLMKVIGAGDSKLFIAAALFAGLKLLGVLALATALIGGVIALGIMIANPRRAVRGLTAKGRAEQGRGIPYGVPIALAALLVMFAPFGLIHDKQIANLPKAGSLLAKPAPAVR